MLLYFLFLIISTGTRQINPCSSLLCDSWSFIQRQQHSTQSLCFVFHPRMLIYTSCIPKRSLSISQAHTLHPNSQVLLEFNMLHQCGKNGFINITNQTGMSISFSASAPHFFFNFLFLLSSSLDLSAPFKHFDSRMHYVSVKCTGRGSCDQMQNVRKHTERERER